MHPALSAAIATVAPVSLLAATHGLGILVRIPGADTAPRVVDTPRSFASPPAPPEPAPVSQSAPVSEPAPLARRPGDALPVLEKVEVGRDGHRGAARAVRSDVMVEAPIDPLEEVDRWILDGERSEDLFPVEAP